MRFRSVGLILFSVAVANFCSGSLPAPTQLIGLTGVRPDVTLHGDLSFAQVVTEAATELLTKHGLYTAAHTAPSLDIDIRAVATGCGNSGAVALLVTLALRDDVIFRRDPSIEPQERATTWSRSGLIMSTRATAKTDALRLVRLYVQGFIDEAEWIKKQYR